MKNTIIGILVIAVLGFGYFLFKKEDPEVIIKKVPVEFEVTVPEQTIVFKPAVLPKPKKVNPRPIEEFKDATDAEKDSLYADAIAERTYEEEYKDSLATTTVTSKVQGRLLEQHVRTDIAEQIITGTTDVEVEIPVEKKVKVLVGGSLGVPLDFGNVQPVLEVGALIQNKKDNIIKIAGDTEKRIILGYYHKIKF